MKKVININFNEIFTHCSEGDLEKMFQEVYNTTGSYDLAGQATRHYELKNSTVMIHGVRFQSPKYLSECLSTIIDVMDELKRKNDHVDLEFNIPHLDDQLIPYFMNNLIRNLWIVKGLLPNIEDELDELINSDDIIGRLENLTDGSDFGHAVNSAFGMTLDEMVSTLKTFLYHLDVNVNVGFGLSDNKFAKKIANAIVGLSLEYASSNQCPLPFTHTIYTHLDNATQIVWELIQFDCNTNIIFIENLNEKERSLDYIILGNGHGCPKYKYVDNTYMIAVDRIVSEIIDEYVWRNNEEFFGFLEEKLSGAIKQHMNENKTPINSMVRDIHGVNMNPISDIVLMYVETSAKMVHKALNIEKSIDMFTIDFCDILNKICRKTMDEKSYEANLTLSDWSNVGTDAMKWGTKCRMTKPFDPSLMSIIRETKDSPYDELIDIAGSCGCKVLKVI